MSKPKRPASRPQQASSSKRSKVSHKANARPFQFGHLPGEIRNQIYFLLVVHPDPISIKAEHEYDLDDTPDSEAAIYGDEDVRLTSSTNHTIEAGILFVNSTIYGEVIPILYGQNTFKFDGPYPWNDFCLFNSSFRNGNERHLRKMSIGFPEIERLTSESGTISEFNGPTSRGIKMLERMDNLDTLSFSLSEDIMAHDIELLKKIRDNCQKAYQLRLPSEELEGNRRQDRFKNQGKDQGQAQDKGGCRIDLRFPKTNVMDADGECAARAVRISTRALESMQRWGWSIKEDFELIGQRHRFNDVEKWLQRLCEERDNSILFGSPSEDDSYVYWPVYY